MKELRELNDTYTGHVGEQILLRSLLVLRGTEAER